MKKMKKIMNTVICYMVEFIVAVIAVGIAAYTSARLMSGSATMYWVNFAMKWNSVYGRLPAWDWDVVMQDRYRIIAVLMTVMVVTIVLNRILNVWETRRIEIR